MKLISQERQYLGPVFVGSRDSSGGGVSSRSCLTLPAVAGEVDCWTGREGGGGGNDGWGLLFRVSAFPLTWTSVGISSGVGAGGGSIAGTVVSSSRIQVI